MILGIEPADEKEVTTFTENIKEGSFFNSDSSNEVVLGAQLIENLRAQIGDSVVLLAQDYYGILENRKFRISGTISFGVQEIESSIIFMGLKTAQSFLSLKRNGINLIAIKSADINKLNELRDILSKNINDSALAVVLWDQVRSGNSSGNSA